MENTETQKSERKLTDQQLLFLGYLGNEAKGNIDEALKLANYAPGSKSHLLKTLKNEIIEISKDSLTGASFKAVKELIDLLDNPNKPGADHLIKVAKEVLNRAGIVAPTDVNVKIPTSGLFILPAKHGSVDDSKGKRTQDEEEEE